jgi:hypothetical protein
MFMRGAWRCSSCSRRVLCCLLLGVRVRIRRPHAGSALHHVAPGTQASTGRRTGGVKCAAHQATMWHGSLASRMRLPASRGGEGRPARACTCMG